MDSLAERANTKNLRLEGPGENFSALRVHIDGVVQGVGFRPFVYGLAIEHGITGWVRNTSAGVDLEVEGPASSLNMFMEALESNPPTLARIDQIQSQPGEPGGYTQFTILPSESFPGGFQPVSPDVSLCPDCRDELWDPEDRRHRYPFINCTNCGPRFTIIRDLPYDRPKTTMAGFELCPECRVEYEDPLDRRFHAQPVACPTCGPQLWLESPIGRIAGTNQALEEARRMLAAGEILAIKGLGGFQLACDAANPSAVDLLRRHKGRPEKPLAVMVYDLEAADALCHLTEADRRLLASRQRPIVLLRIKESRTLAPNVAPGQSNLGLMLPYTPLHELLLEPSDGFPHALIMTSGNLSGAPIIHTNSAARTDLRIRSEGLLLHDRPIESRCDDSVVRTFQSSIYPIRRARGYAPDPIKLSIPDTCVLAAGAELKNTFCITKEKRALLSPHIGDLKNFETLAYYEESVQHFERLFRSEPEALAYDIHPDYLSTQYALERARREALPAFPIQHHHAHIAACLAEHGRSFTEPAIGFAFDGTGYGPDGAIWGGEVLLASDGDFERAYHLRYLPMAGGEKAILEPWRLALAWLDQAGIDWTETLPAVAASTPEARRILRQQITQGINAPLTSSLGRLFDAVASLIGVRHTVSYEAQAAIELEEIATISHGKPYKFGLERGVIDPAPVMHAIVRDYQAHIPAAEIAGRFHQGLAELVRSLADDLRSSHGISLVVLSGGVWQNMMLLEQSCKLLTEGGFEVLTHRKVPTNDGGISLGQAWLTCHYLDKGIEPSEVAARLNSHNLAGE